MENKVVSKDLFLDKLSEKFNVNGYSEKGNIVFARRHIVPPPPLGFWSTKKGWDWVKWSTWAGAYAERFWGGSPNPAGGLEGAVSRPAGSGAEPRKILKLTLFRG